MAVGEFDVRAYREDGIKYWDAVDPRLYEPNAPPAPESSSRSPSPRTPRTSG